MVEYAEDRRGIDALERSLSRAHPRIVAAVNEKRRAMGLPEVRTAGDPKAPYRLTATAAATQASRLARLKAHAALVAARLRQSVQPSA